MAELFHQTYDPVAGSILLSAIVAAVPPILLALMLAVWVNAWMTEEVVWAKGRVRVRVAPPAAPEQEG